MTFKTKDLQDIMVLTYRTMFTFAGKENTNSAAQYAGVLNRAIKYFRPDNRLYVYKIQIRPHEKLSSSLNRGIPITTVFI